MNNDTENNAHETSDRLAWHPEVFTFSAPLVTPVVLWFINMILIYSKSYWGSSSCNSRRTSVHVQCSWWIYSDIKWQFYITTETWTVRNLPRSVYNLVFHSLFIQFCWLFISTDPVAMSFYCLPFISTYRLVI
jgi:hypothetical protein